MYLQSHPQTPHVVSPVPLISIHPQPAHIRFSSCGIDPSSSSSASSSQSRGFLVPVVMMMKSLMMMMMMMNEVG